MSYFRTATADNSMQRNSLETNFVVGLCLWGRKKSRSTLETERQQDGRKIGRVLDSARCPVRLGAQTNIEGI